MEKSELAYVAWLLLVYLKNIVDVMIQCCVIWLRVNYWTLKVEYVVMHLFDYMFIAWNII